jgi:hypothetical protein
VRRRATVRATLLAGAIGVTVMAGLVTVAGAVPTRAADTLPATGRVLVISLPATEWADFTTVRTPNLDRLFASSAIGAMVTNGVDRPTTLPSGYATVGAGARASVSATTGGQGFAVDEPFGRDSAGVVFATRTGTSPGRGEVYMPIAATVADNDAALYGADVGLLGDQLAAAKISRAVIANGDGTDPASVATRLPPYRRAAVAALMTSAGRVPGGQVDPSLLEPDPTAAFGLRLDPTRVLDAFSAAWKPRSVVLVEGSDLVRADLAAGFASEDQAVAIRARALRDTDRLVGRLLQHVDPRRDAVVVIGPVPPGATDALTVAAVRGPGFDPGLLRATTTQRDGFVNLVDVAPTILHWYGIARPDAMEGRTMESGATGETLAARTEFLAHVNQDGLFRDSLVGASMSVVLVLACLLGVGAVAVDRWRLWRRWPSALAFGALALLGVLTATYLAGPAHFSRHGGVVAYWVFVGGVGLSLAAACMVVCRRRPVDALLVGLGSVVALHLVDLVTGAHLEWNTVFGYSPTIGIRFVGEGNMTFAQLSAAAVLFAALLAWRVPSRRGVRIAVTLLAVTVVVIGAPFWGNDLGGAISAAPGFALLAWLLLGRELRWRSVFWLVGVFVASGIAVGLLDLLRPPDERTHVGKFFEKAGTNFDSATLVLRRKAAENFAVLGHSLLLGCLVVVALLIVYLTFVPPRSIRSLLDRIPTARAAALSLTVVAVLGFALNDSGIAIPGMMAAVFESALVFLLARVAFVRLPVPEVSLGEREEARGDDREEARAP